MKMFRSVHDGKKVRGGESGFTLMEVLIAVAILAIGVVGVVNIFPVGLQAASRAADFTRVSLLVQSAVDFYRGEGWEYVDDMFWDAGNYGGGPIYVNGGENVFIPLPQDTDAVPERGGGMPGAREFDEYEGFFWRLEISDEVDGGNVHSDDAEIYKLTLHVYWLDRGQEQWEPFEFHISKYD